MTFVIAKPRCASSRGDSTDSGASSPDSHSQTDKPEISSDLEAAPVSSKINTNQHTASGEGFPPPDGGWLAWSQVFAAHLVAINTWGTINSFGIFQTFYATKLPQSSSSISWIGSMQVFFLFVVGVFTGRLTDAGYFRATFAAGSVLVVFGSCMASISTTYWQLFLSQGVCMGLGMGGLFCPVMAVLSTYFCRRRNLAIGLAISGASVGGMIYPSLARQLIPRIGFPWTMRAMSCVQLVTLTVSNIFAKARLPPRRSGPLVELSAFKELPYSLFTVGIFFSFWGVYFAFYYIGAFSRDVLSFDYTSSLNLLIIINGVGAIGRILPGFLADLYFGPLNVITPAAFVCMTMLYCWIRVNSALGLYCWAVIYGIFGATVQGLFPAALSSLTQDLQKSGTRMGMVYSIVSFANLTGPPLAGCLIAKGDPSYNYAFVFGGTSLCVGTAFLVACRAAKGGLRFAKV